MSAHNTDYVSRLLRYGERCEYYRLRLKKAEELIAEAYFDDYCIALYWDEENSEYRFDYEVKA
jgi:hypothetical protein